MGYPQITQIRTDFSEQNNGFRFFQITKDTPFPHLWKSVKSVDENPLPPALPPPSAVRPPFRSGKEHDTID